MLNKNKAFFSSVDGDWFTPNAEARGPWSEDACHAGPPTGLIARALEKVVTDKPLTRLTVNLLRPIPMAGFRIAAQVTKNGRVSAISSAELIDAQGRVCASANALHLAAQGGGYLACPPADSPDLDSAKPGNFPMQSVSHSLLCFSNGIEVMYPPGEEGSLGPTTMWMRTLPLLEGEIPSDFQRLCPLADCGNGLSRNAELTDAMFMNPDITIAVHRLPESDWLASRATSYWQSTGVGLSEATLFDQKGPIGTAIQTLVVQAIEND